MPAKKIDPVPEVPVTVGELLLVLASFPQDAPLTSWENGGGGGTIAAMIGDETIAIWEGGYIDRPQHYVAPTAVVIERGHPGDDFALAQDFLAWMDSADLVLRHPGHGHGEGDLYVSATDLEIAQRFAERSLDS